MSGAPSLVAVALIGAGGREVLQFWSWCFWGTTQEEPATDALLSAEPESVYWAHVTLTALLIFVVGVLVGFVICLYPRSVHQGTEVLRTEQQAPVEEVSLGVVVQHEGPASNLRRRGGGVLVKSGARPARAGLV